MEWFPGQGERIREILFNGTNEKVLGRCFTVVFIELKIFKIVYVCVLFNKQETI